jgi:hypothetical protein
LARASVGGQVTIPLLVRGELWRVVPDPQPARGLGRARHSLARNAGILLRGQAITRHKPLLDLFMECLAFGRLLHIERLGTAQLGMALSPAAKHCLACLPCQSSAIRSLSKASVPPCLRDHLAGSVVREGRLGHPRRTRGPLCVPLWLLDSSCGLGSGSK